MCLLWKWFFGVQLKQIYFNDAEIFNTAALYVALLCHETPDEAEVSKEK